jgi:hypothetical protein
MENIEKDRNIYILADNQAAIEALNNVQISSKPVWDCHQSLVRLAEHNRVPLTWVPGHIEIGGNSIPFSVLLFFMRSCFWLRACAVPVIAFSTVVSAF